MVHLSLMLFAGSLFTKSLAVSSSGFVASDESVSFALNIPEANGSNDLYFTLSGPASSSWIAIGMGNDEMEDTLMFMIYADATGKNITLSPRLSHGHVEPTYAKDIGVSVLVGSGIENGTMKANAMCTNCRTWGEHSINPKDVKAKFIFGSGSGSLKSDSLSADITRHSSYGAFTMDLSKAVGGESGVPVVTSNTGGTVETSDKTDHDFGPALHAVAMILAFVGFMPLGWILLRIFQSPKLHGYNQALSSVVALIGVGLGIYIGTMYNRTNGYTSAHQIFGIIITVALVGQFILGFVHHRIYKKTLTTTKLAPIHVWLGRLIIPAGIANGFLGFPLALNSKYNWALLGLVLLGIIVLLPLAFWRYKRNAQKKNISAGNDSESTGYQSQPWTRAPSRSDINLDQMNYPSYQDPTQGRQFV